MAQVSFSDLVDGVIHTAAHHNDRFNALKSRINAIQSDNLEDSSVTGPKIAMGSDAQGDILIRGVTSYQRLAAGTSGQFLKTLGAGANPLWATVFGSTKIINFTRDLTASGGAVPSASIGFAPKIIIFFGGITSGSSISGGFIGSAESGGTAGSISTDNNPNWDVDTTNALFIYGAGSSTAYQTATVSAWGADTFTLTWTKTNFPTGTATIIAVVLG